jgi:hypothetical protein
MTVLNRIDAKITMIGNNFNIGGGTPFSPAQPQSSASTSSTSVSAITSPHVGQNMPAFQHSNDSSRGDSENAAERPKGVYQKLRNGYQHLTPPHKLFIWPEVHNYLKQYDPGIDAELQRIRVEGSAFFIKKEVQKYPNALLPDVHLISKPVGASQGTALKGGFVEFPALTYDRLVTLAEAYFMTFYCTHPAVDPAEFKAETLATVLRQGFGLACEDSVIVLMVCALGEMAIEGTTGPRWKGTPNSGIRGGSLERPPGLVFFNEVRRRLGFISTANSVKSVQILILIACVLPRATPFGDQVTKLLSQDILWSLRKTCGMPA